VIWCALTSLAAAQEGATPPHWIWYPPAANRNDVPAETRYFRKTFEVKEPSRLVLSATADNAFTLYLDGKEVAAGSDWHLTQDFQSTVAVGEHVLAAAASNEAPGPAGLLVRGGVLPLGQGVPIHTNSSWKTTGAVPPGDAWTKAGFDDSSWVRARDLGAVGTSPWGNVASSADAAARFRVPEGFQVATAAAPRVTGSVVAFTFDPDGAPCVSIEQGPIARLVDDDQDGRYDRRAVIENQVRNCQGLAFIRGWLFAVGNGPDGAGIYRLADANRDGLFEQCALLRSARGGMGEHGPHAVGLGPDGRLYYNNGNHAHLNGPIDPGSPVSVAYEGELLPHYNDSRGHAAGIMAPGGEILRSDDDGKTWTRAAAGFRNEYDFAFNTDAELFTFDSDMEWDVGLPWYRPVRVCHCPLGAEFGWRNGSGKWPAYYIDSLPATFDVGRGSPTGVTFYQAKQFPPECRDTFLVCDWSQGRILAINLKRQGASYGATASELVSGQPLNCTDIEVGPDGAVYFTTGGRGTQGGLFRVSWSQAKPDPPLQDPTVADALAFTSPLASFTQRRFAAIKKRDPDAWGRALEAVARSALGKQPAVLRVRALDLLSQHGPRPSDELLISLANDADARVRARAVALLGLRSSPSVRDALAQRLDDEDAFVRRRACEGLMQQPRETIPISKLMPLLADPDRFIRFAARVAIEHGEQEELSRQIGTIGKAQTRLLIESLLARVRRARLDEQAQDDLLRTQTGLLAQTAGDHELRADLLRMIELTYLLGPRKADAAASASLRPVLLGLFSSSEDTPLNRETARLLAFLDEPRAVSLLLEHQATVSNLKAQIHDAYCLRAMKKGWTSEAKQQLWAWHEQASKWEGGYSFQGYLDFMIQESVALLDPHEREVFLARGERFPFPTRVLVRALDLDSDPSRTKALAALYPRLDSAQRTGTAADLRALVVEKLGKSRRTEAHAALRQLYRLNPQDREPIARALAARPVDSDLPILVSALESRDTITTGLALRGLDRLNAVPTGPEPLASLIRLARLRGPDVTGYLDRLASRWTGLPMHREAQTFAEVLAAWETVYRDRFGDRPPLDERSPAAQRSYSLRQLVDNVLRAGVMKSASSERGGKVIEKAKCLDCHKFGSKGEGVGPDLSTLNSRFRPEEILESIIEPSKVISDQYKPVTVATADGKLYSGMPVVSDGANLVLLLPDATRVTIPTRDIDAKKESSVSVMPAGLINSLTYQEIADLLALFESAPRALAPAAGEP
jgi:putative heme-binding domain-containing protein